MLKKEKYWGFWNSSLLQNINKMETKKFEKRRTVPKKNKAGTLHSRPFLFLTFKME